MIHRISEGAWNYFIVMATKLRYVREGSNLTIRARMARRERGGLVRTKNRPQGISTFLNVLSKAEFVDTCPDYVRKRHEAEEAGGEVPSWRLYQAGFTNDDKIARDIEIYESSALRYIEIARKFGIAKRRRGGAGKSERAIVTAVLEAIGAGLISPRAETLPMCESVRDKRWTRTTEGE